MVPNFSLIGIALLLTAVFNVFVVFCGGCIAIRISGSLKKPTDAGESKNIKSRDKPSKSKKSQSKDFTPRDELSEKRPLK